MAIEDILETLDSEGAQERKQVALVAKEEAKRIIDVANEDAERIKQKELERMSLSVKAETARILNQAMLFKKEKIAEAKEKIIGEVFESNKVQLNSLRKSASYEKVFENLAREALGRASGDIVVLIDKRDEAIARKVLDKLCKNYELRTDLDCLGGLMVKTSNEKVTYLNTIDARLDKAAQVLKSEITEALFGS